MSRSTRPNVTDKVELLARLLAQAAALVEEDRIEYRMKHEPRYRELANGVVADYETGRISNRERRSRMVFIAQQLNAADEVLAELTELSVGTPKEATT